MFKRVDFARQVTQFAYRQPVSKNVRLISSDRQTNHHVLNMLLVLSTYRLNYENVWRRTGLPKTSTVANIKIHPHKALNYKGNF